MEKIRVVYLDVLGGRAPQILTIRENNNLFYKLLNCNSLEVVTAKIAGIPVRIICDEEFLFKDPFIPSAVTPDCVGVLYGNLIICGYDIVGEGYLTGLSESDCRLILQKKKLLLCCNQTRLTYAFEIEK